MMRLRAALLGTYLSSAVARSMRRRAATLTGPDALKTRDTVATDTRARRATSRMVARRSGAREADNAGDVVVDVVGALRRAPRSLETFTHGNVYRGSPACQGRRWRAVARRGERVGPSPPASSPWTRASRRPSCGSAPRPSVATSSLDTRRAAHRPRGPTSGLYTRGSTECGFTRRLAEKLLDPET